MLSQPWAVERAIRNGHLLPVSGLVEEILQTQQAQEG